MLVILFFYFLVLVGQAECWLQPTGADQRGYNPARIFDQIDLLHIPINAWEAILNNIITYL